MDISRLLPPASLSPAFSGTLAVFSQSAVSWRDRTPPEPALMPNTLVPNTLAPNTLAPNTLEDTYEPAFGLERAEEYGLDVSSTENARGEGGSSGTRDSGGFRAYAASHAARNGSVTPQAALGMYAPGPENGEIVDVYA